MKNGGAELVIHPSSRDGVRTVGWDWGEVTFRQFNDGNKITRRDMLYMLRCAEDEVLKGDTY